jgi:hypothetical protein
VALLAPLSPAQPAPFDLPWTLTGGRGIYGLDPVHGALAVWGALMAFTLLFIVISALMTSWWWRRLNRREARAVSDTRELVQLSPSERARLRAEAGELIRQAAVTAAAAKRAEATVTETNRMREVAEHARAAAWEAFDSAQRAYEQALTEAGARADALGGESGLSAEAQAQNRELTRAALDAFRRGDLKVDELNAVFKQAAGWDPLQELQAREVELRRTAESRARRLYQAAAAAERSAVKAADVAAVAARALAEEAVEVAEEALLVREELNAAIRVRRDAPVMRKIPRQRSRNRQVSRA